MGTYVISDIHGCKDEFFAMLHQIHFTDADQMIVAGDCIDRGTQNYEMLRWMELCPENICLLRGNHEEEFTAYVDIMLSIDEEMELETDADSNVDTEALYESVRYAVKYAMKSTGSFGLHFDPYGTLRVLIRQNQATLSDLCRWSSMIRKMPYYRKLQIGERLCVTVHAGYAQEFGRLGADFSTPEEFYLYAREEGISLGGLHHGMVVAGHTPTVVKGLFVYNHGNVFRYYDQEKDCIFYDIDCGCVFRKNKPDAKLACIRLEDEKVFYI